MNRLAYLRGYMEKRSAYVRMLTEMPEDAGELSRLIASHALRPEKEGEELNKGLRAFLEAGHGNTKDAWQMREAFQHMLNRNGAFFEHVETPVDKAKTAELTNSHIRTSPELRDANYKRGK